MLRRSKCFKILFLLLATFVVFVTVDNPKSNAASAKITSVSKLGKVKNENVIIYKNINNLKSRVKAGADYTNRVYYVKKQAVLNGVTYYSINTSASTTQYLGWVKSSDLSLNNHKSIDKKQKTFYLRGTGAAYNRPWGGSKNAIYKSLNPYKFYVFKVNLTEMVGKTTWYRGTLNGKTVWISSGNVAKSITKSNTSRLGQLKNNAVIYNKLSSGAKKLPNTNYLNQVYYIKQQAKIGSDTYYLISTQASKTSGLVGWVKSTEITSYAHARVDNKVKTLYIKGTGAAYNKPWGGSKNAVYKSLSSYKFTKFSINLTDKVGNNTWYRGTLNGKTVWIHSSHVSNAASKTDVSRVGKLKNTSVIYNKLASGFKTVPVTNYLNTVLYVKQQAKFGNEVYYLISTKASKTEGLIGWVKSSDISSLAHTSLDKKQKLFYVKGTGQAFGKIWGGSKDVKLNLKDYVGKDFFVNLTEKAGNDTWYRGTLEGKSVWIHSSYLTSSIIIESKYNISFSNALSLQMKTMQQTDKYRNSPAYVNSKYISNIQGEITGSTVNLRTSAKIVDNNIGTSVKKGTKVSVLNTNVTGDSVSGSTKWYQIKHGDKIYYIHSSLLKVTGTTTEKVNVQVAASATSHIYGTVAKGDTVTITNIGSSWHTISFSTWRNATSEDVKYYLNPANFSKDSVQKFQFLDLRRTSGVTAAKLNEYLKGKGIFEGRGQAFIDAGKNHGINELYLVAHAMLETGYGHSQLATGVKYEGKTVYNMYGIGAYDSCPLSCGTKRAYEEGWTTPEKAIIGGAKFVSESYIYGKNTHGFVQNTLYKMRWNPEAMATLGYTTHQYATDVGWASKQVNTLYNLYNTLNIKNVVLDIPVYK